MRVLVTGGAGFLGSHLVDTLVKTGHDVTVIDNLYTGASENIHPAARFIEKDIRDDLSGAFTAIKPEVVLHLAAQVSVASSVHDPALDLAFNVGGTVNIMESAARHGVRKVVAISSAAVYGTPTVMPIVEDAPTIPVSPYGLSKLTGERYLHLLSSLRGLPATILRPSNIYGPRQRTEGEGAVVPAFLSRFLGGHDPVIHGRGDQTRDFVFVSDMVRALVLAMDRADGLTLNVSSGTQTTILELWQRLAELTSWRRRPVFGPLREGDIKDSLMDNASARLNLGWTPEMGIQEGLALTVAWASAQLAAAARQD